jgi:hypothetical protein
MMTDYNLVLAAMLVVSTKTFITGPVPPLGKFLDAPLQP